MNNEILLRSFQKFLFSVNNDLVVVLQNALKNMKNKINQTTSWKEQSFRYAKSVKSNNHQLFEKYFSFFSKKNIRNMLDVGCGNGDFLGNFLKNKKGWN